MAPLLLLLRPRRPPLHPLPVPALLRPAVPSPRRSTAAQERRGTTTISTWTTRARIHMHEISRRGATFMMNLNMDDEEPHHDFCLPFCGAFSLSPLFSAPSFGLVLFFPLCSHIPIELPIMNS